MPAKSKKQRKLMKGVAEGSIRKKGVSKADAKKVLGEHGKKRRKK